MRKIIIAIALLATLVPTTVVAQTQGWQVLDGDITVGNDTTVFRTEFTRSFNGGEVTWTSDPASIYLSSGNAGGYASLSVDRERVDCPNLSVQETPEDGYVVSEFTVPNGCIPAGEYQMFVRVSNIEGGDGSQLFGPVDYTAPGGDIPDVEFEEAAVTRLAGGSRYETAVEVSRFQFPNGSARVALVNANIQVDALPGSQIGGGPILYVPADGDVPQVVLDEVARLNPREVIVLGGTLAVSDDVVAQVRAQTQHRTN